MNKFNAAGVVFLCVFTFFYSGCATITPMQTLQERSIGASPELNVIAVAAVGDTIVNQFDYIKSEKYYVAQHYARSIGFNKIAIAQGTELVQVLLDAEPALCTTVNAYFTVGDSRPICIFEEGSAGIYRKGFVVNTLKSTAFDVSVLVKKQVLMQDSGGFKYDLLYQGIDKGTARLSYREYFNNFTRPSFQQDIIYTLDKNGKTQASFKGLRIEILSADNNEIKYIIRKYFSEPKETTTSGVK